MDQQDNIEHLLNKLNNSFWLKNPIQINNTTSKLIPILSSEKIGEHIQKNLSNTNIQLDFTIYHNYDVTKEKCEKYLLFLNEHYVRNQHLKLHYSFDLFYYYLTSGESLIIECHPKNKKDKLIGLIVGKKRQVYFNKIMTPVLEVNFLCIIDKLRNLHVAPILISKLSLECLLQYNILHAYYTIDTPIKSTPFCQKLSYHVPLNEEKLIKIGFFGENKTNVDLSQYYHKQLNNITFINRHLKNVKYDTCIYINGTLYHVDVNELHKFILDFYLKSCTIFDEMTINELKLMLYNKSFHHFVFYENDKIVDYICFYQLNSMNMNSQLEYRNGFMYIYCLNIDQKSSKTRLCYVLNYLKQHDILDMITTNQKSWIECLNYIEGTAHLKYYMYNTHIPMIQSDKNGLVTI